MDTLIADTAKPPSAIKTKNRLWHYDGENSLVSEKGDILEREREREREKERWREREREQSPGCESFSRQLLFANMSVGTWSLDKLKTLVEFVI